MINSSKYLKVYFIGIGGISMSSLAIYLHNKNFTVLGRDNVKSERTVLLEKLGITVYYDDNLQAVKDSDIIVYTAAIKDTDAELMLAKKLSKPIYKRSQLLSLIISSFNKSIGVSGSHGKTTITAMISHILKSANKSFTAFIGGQDNSFSNFYTDGEKNLILTEVCEYKNSISDIKVDFAICSNIDNDHLDTYQNIENIKNAFFEFLDRSKIKVICNDDKYLNEYKGNGVVTYGINAKSDVTASNLTNLIGKYSFDLIIKNKNLGRINLNVFGKCSVYNALCATAVCYSMQIPLNAIRKGLRSFTGVQRRFEYIGKLYKKTIVCDYAHHPTEILNTITTAKQIFNDNLLLIFEPHTFSRTKLLFYDFLNVFENENVYFYKTYPARESYFYDGSSEKLALSLNKKYLETFNELLSAIKTAPYKNVLIIGAGELYDKIINVIEKPKS